MSQRHLFGESTPPRKKKPAKEDAGELLQAAQHTMSALSREKAAAWKRTIPMGSSGFMQALKLLDLDEIKSGPERVRAYELVRVFLAQVDAAIDDERPEARSEPCPLCNRPGRQVVHGVDFGSAWTHELELHNALAAKASGRTPPTHWIEYLDKHYPGVQRTASGNRKRKPH